MVITGLTNEFRRKRNFRTRTRKEFMFDHFFKAFQQKPCEISPFMDSLSQLGRIRFEGLVYSLEWMAFKTETKRIYE